MSVEMSQAEIYAAFARGNLGKAIHLADSRGLPADLYGELLHLLKHLKKYGYLGAVGAASGR